MKVLFTFIGFVFSGSALAFYWAPPATITGYYVYANGGAYIRTSSNQNPDGCTYSAYLFVDTNAQKFKELWATIMAAQATGSTVSINYNGCSGGYPVVNSVAVPNVW